MKNDRAVIIAAGGGGKRFGGRDKLFELLGGIPVFIHSIRNFLEVCPPENIIISAPADKIDLFKSELEKYLPGTEFSLVNGGSERMLSVKNALDTIPEHINYAAIHDAARPLASAALLTECFEKAALHGGAVAAKPVTDTIKKASAKQFVLETLDRSELWAMETPQAFELARFRKAYEKALRSGKNFTDDAGIMEFAGENIYLVRNPAPNIKITYSHDIEIAETFLHS